ncbi:MAG: hypothetical protein AAGJ87_17840, partial [Pseudomonadota bacterium]
LQVNDTRTNLFDEIDYLSTVSGGGYAGAAVTWFRHLAHSKPKREDVRQFAQTDSEGARPSRSALMSAYRVARRYKAPLADFPKIGRHAHGAGADAVNYIRFRKNHLTPTLFLNFLSMTGVAIRTSLLSLPIYLSVIVAAFIVIGAATAPAIDRLPSLVSSERDFINFIQTALDDKAFEKCTLKENCEPAAFLNGFL